MGQGIQEWIIEPNCVNDFMVKCKQNQSINVLF